MKLAVATSLLLLFAVPTPDKVWPPLPAAKRGEWRWRHAEQPQTLDQYRAAQPRRPGPVRRFVYLLPAWTRPGTEEQLAPQLDELLAAYFGYPVKRLKPRAMPQRAYDATGRRFSVRALVPFLRRQLPDDAVFLLAITDRDLRLPNARHTDGWGSLKLRVGIATNWRLSAGRLSEDRNPLRRRRRYLSLVLHEATHMLSVPHCTQRTCLMNGAMDFQEADRRPLLLCWECRDKLCWNAGLDPRRRYDDLAGAWTGAGFPRMAKRIARAAQTLPSEPSTRPPGASPPEPAPR